MSELNRCYVCGSQVEIIDESSYFDGREWVNPIRIICENCGTQSPSFDESEEKDLIDWWNGFLGKSFSSWVSVHDRLPGEKGTYLTVTIGGCVRVNHYYGDGKWGYGNNCSYWAQLPLPPSDV